MPFPHVGNGLTQVACRYSFYRRFAFAIGNAGELIQAGFAGAAAARSKSSLRRAGCSPGMCSGHVRQHRLIYPEESKSKRAALRAQSDLTVAGEESDECDDRKTHMQLDTKFLRLRTAVTLGSRFGDWQVCWVGGWNKHRIGFMVMLVRVSP
jgi:hypothetical protein